MGKNYFFSFLKSEFSSLWLTRLVCLKNNSHLNTLLATYHKFIYIRLNSDFNILYPLPHNIKVYSYIYYTHFLYKYRKNQNVTFPCSTTPEANKNFHTLCQYASINRISKAIYRKSFVLGTERERALLLLQPDSIILLSGHKANNLIGHLGIGNRAGHLQLF